MRNGSPPCPERVRSNPDLLNAILEAVRPTASAQGPGDSSVELATASIASRPGYVTLQANVSRADGLMAASLIPLDSWFAQLALWPSAGFHWRLLTLTLDRLRSPLHSKGCRRGSAGDTSCYHRRGDTLSVDGQHRP
jgi:hypothetical protein